jgi:regulator of nucleoside diphosphate kinase
VEERPYEKQKRSIEGPKDEYDCCYGGLIQVHGAPVNRPRTLPGLQKKLEEAEVFNSCQIPGNVVTMNSTVLLRDMESGEEVVRTLAFPHGADPARGRVSILTSIGIAMIGNKVGDVLECEAPDGAKRFRVERILYQPEAANDDDR